MASNRSGSRENEAKRKQEELNDRLALLREELDKKALRIGRDREMHRQRRKKEAEAREAVQSQDPAVRRRKDFVKNEYGLIDEAKDEQIRHNKIRQNLINDPEIQDLYNQLQVSYVRKQLQAQFDEKKVELVRSKESVGTEQEEVEKVVKSEADYEEMLKQKDMKKKAEYRKQIQDQIIDKYKLKQEEYREALKERAVLEDAMRCTMEEDQMEVFRKRMMRDKIRKDIDEFRKAKALWMLREKELQEEQDRKIKEFIAMKEKLQNETKKKEKAKRDQFQRNRVLVFDIMSQKQNSRDEDERKILEKCEQEAERKAVEKEENQLLAEHTAKRSLRDAFARQNADKQERLRILKQEERDYVKQKLIEYKEDEEHLRMTAQKRRRLKMAYKSAVLRDIQEKIYRKQLEEKEEMEATQLEKQAKKEKKKLISEERALILNQHTGQLIGYLPPGFLKHSDLPHLPEQVRDYYTRNNQQKT